MTLLYAVCRYVYSLRIRYGGQPVADTFPPSGCYRVAQVSQHKLNFLFEFLNNDAFVRKLLCRKLLKSKKFTGGHFFVCVCGGGAVKDKPIADRFLCYICILRKNFANVG